MTRSQAVARIRSIAFRALFVAVVAFSNCGPIGRPIVGGPEQDSGIDPDVSSSDGL